MKTWTVAIEDISKIPEKVVRGTVMGMFSRIVKRSPVDTGRFRGNWQITVDAPARGEVGPDKSGANTIASAANVAQNQRFPASAYFISNNMPYAEKLEFGGYPSSPKKQTGKTQNGYSTQAPNGMVRISVAEFERVIREEAAKL
jgi:hypothetical protein